MIAYIGLGANLDYPQQQINTALHKLSNHQDIHVTTHSSLYQSKPIDNSHQPDYINVVCQLDTTLSAIALLRVCQQIEDEQHRVRHKKWGARTIDLDILLYDQQVITTKELVIPHPQMQYRAFVLIPLQEIAPDIHIPLLGHIKQLVAGIESSSVTKVRLLQK